MFILAWARVLLGHQLEHFQRRFGPERVCLRSSLADEVLGVVSARARHSSVSLTSALAEGARLVVGFSGDAE